MTKKQQTIKIREMKRALLAFPAAVKQQERAYKEEMKIKKAFGTLSLDLMTPPPHPWRLCPLGHFYRKSHSQKAYTRKNSVRVRASLHPHECVPNKSGKDQLYAEEIQEIALRHFAALTHLPTSKALPLYPNEATFDPLIAGWTKYWNEVLQPTELLDHNFVKALIATESSFQTDAHNGKRGKNRARGLMQVTDESVRLLAFRGKELKDHFVNLKEDDMLDPILAICAGIRWLFRKKEIAASKSKAASWMETVMLYKNYKSINDRQMQKFISIYKTLSHHP